MIAHGIFSRGANGCKPGDHSSNIFLLLAKKQELVLCSVPHPTVAEKMAACLLNFWATVYKTVRPMLSDRCLVLSVCDVGAPWIISMKLGTQVGLGPGHIVSKV